MNILFWGLTEWIVAFSVHIFVTRIEKKHYSKINILIVFLLVYSLFIISNCFNLLKFPYKFPENFIEHIFLFMFFYSMVIGYITVIFQQVEGDSPTLFIIRLIGNNRKGISNQEVFEKVLSKPFFDTRLDELINDRAIYLKNDKYYIRKQGMYYNLFRMISAYRKKVLRIDSIGG